MYGINLKTQMIYEPHTQYKRNNDKDTGARFTPQDLEEGAIAIPNALWNKHKDVNGKWQKVNAGMMKVGFVPGLSEAAHMLYNKLLRIQMFSHQAEGETKDLTYLIVFACNLNNPFCFA